ncbi:Glycosyltransferase like family protein [Paracidovorax cattleyae]|uniref:Glycosyltransferase like family protein n=2 Tax=Paracidovorax cattleyae TaxID=80868 RepID=A0A1H0P737_9BURK|nr:glycosyltransferase [Paracidovorax cattleyae]AVS76095.1 hypothetical protein C8240_20755 [Paracidovorax cattleyae]SDP00754.1 Glycosyltransferase like family protein [Paracidovorax cattleyae]
MRVGLLLHKCNRWLQSVLEKSFVGKIINHTFHEQRERRSTVCFVAATRLSKDDFSRKAWLGKRLNGWRDQQWITTRIAYENRKGLPAVYNQAIDQAQPHDVLVFLHDDTWLTSEESVKEILRGLRRYDVIGIAGNTRRTPGQPAWHLRKEAEGDMVWDHPHLSGAVRYGTISNNQLNQFGPWPADCELLDGVMLAARADVLKRAGLRFDERFDFHFYDLDFSRSARALGLRIGTWPVQLLHESAGNFGDPKWSANCDRYLEKWHDYQNK